MKFVVILASFLFIDIGETSEFCICSNSASNHHHGYLGLIRRTSPRCYDIDGFTTVGDLFLTYDDSKLVIFAAENVHVGYGATCLGRNNDKGIQRRISERFLISTIHDLVSKIPVVGDVVDTVTDTVSKIPGVGDAVGAVTGTVDQVASSTVGKVVDTAGKVIDVANNIPGVGDVVSAVNSVSPVKLEHHTNSDGSSTTGISVDAGPLGNVDASVDTNGGKVSGVGVGGEISIPDGPEAGAHVGVHNSGDVDLGGKVGVNVGGIVHAGVQGGFSSSNNDLAVGPYASVGIPGAEVSAHTEIHTSDGHVSGGAQGSLGSVSGGVDFDQNSGVQGHIQTPLVGISGSSSSSSSLGSVVTQTTPIPSTGSQGGTSHPPSGGQGSSGTSVSSNGLPASMMQSMMNFKPGQMSSGSSNLGGFNAMSMNSQVGVDAFMQKMYGMGRRR